MAHTESLATEESTTTLTSLTPAQIDGERARLWEQVRDLTDPTEAERVEARILALAAARPIALARERAKRRREQAEAAQRAHDGFDALATEFPAEVRARASAIDAAIREFERVMADYRVTVQRLGEFAPYLRQGPSPAPGHELDLRRRADKLSLSLLIERQLALAGVLDHVTVPGSERDLSFSFEAYIQYQVQAFLDLARTWLPAVADQEPAMVDDGNYRLVHEDSPQQGDCHDAQTRR